jgi:type I restriction enzyme S subunit
VTTIRLRYLLRPREVTDRTSLQVLSVYRDYGVIPKNSRSDNFNKTPEDITRYQEVRVGDLVVNKMKAWQGSVGISAHHGIVSPDYLVCSVAPSVDSRFMHHLLRSAPLAAEFGARSKGIRPAQWRLYWEDLAEIRINLPILDKQRQIADFLDVETTRIDGLTALRNCQVDLLEDRYRTAISEFVTPGISSARERNARWPWLPARISTSRLGYAARVQTGITVDSKRETTDDDAEYPYLRVANVQGEHIDLAEIKTIIVPRSVAIHSTLMPGDLVMTEANGNPDNLGRGAVWRGEVHGMVHQNHIFAIRADPGKLMPEYLSALLVSDHGRRYFRTTSTQVGIATTSSSKVLNFPVPLLPMHEQRRVVKQCEEARTVISRGLDVLTRQLALLTERRQALITAAVTGGITV